MSKKAVIRFRASTELKSRVERLAKRKEQDLSDYLRLRTIEIVEAEERALGLAPIAASTAVNDRPATLVVPERKPVAKSKRQVG